MGGGKIDMRNAKHGRLMLSLPLEEAKSIMAEVFSRTPKVENLETANEASDDNRKGIMP